MEKRKLYYRRERKGGINKVAAVPDIAVTGGQRSGRQGKIDES